MKTSYNKIIIMLLLAIPVLFLQSCNDGYEPNTEVLVKTHTISEFLADYATEAGTFFPVRENSGTANLYSVDQVPSGGSNIVIEGIVVSSDTAGNVYKSIYIQDPVQPEIGLKISIDAAALSGIMPLGQSISIKCNGLGVGKYGDMYQLGIVYFNNSDTIVESERKKRGYEPGRVPLPMFKKRVQYNGLPKMSDIVVHDMTVSEIIASGRNVHGRLVRIRNAQFTDNNVIFAEDTNGIGFPTSRNISDGTGVIAIATSEFARFAKKKTPAAGVTGDVVALVGWYRDKDTNAGSWQLTIRSLDDLVGFY